MGTNKKWTSAGRKVAIGGVMAAVGAGAYYFLGPDGKKHQEKAKVLIEKAKKEIGGKVKKVKSIVKKIS